MSARKRRRRFLVWSAAVLVCAGGVVAYSLYRGSYAGQGTSKTQDPYQLVPVERGSIAISVTASGTVNAGSLYQVNPRMNGTIREVLIEPGDRVAKGQVLVVLDDADSLEALQEARDALAVAQAKLVEAQTQAEIAPVQSRLDIEQARTNLLNAETKLAQLKAGPKPQDIEQARSQVNQARLSVDAARKEYERTSGLFQQGAVTRQQVDAAESKHLSAIESLTAAEQKLDLLLSQPDPDEVAAAEAAVAQARTSLRMAEEKARTSGAEQQLLTARAQVAQARNAVSAAERRLGDTRIASPIDGTVLEVESKPGQVVSQSSVLLVVADLQHLEILANVDEMDVHAVKPGQVVYVKADSSPGRVFRGTVESVAAQGKTISSIVYFGVTIRVDDDTGTLRVGMTADVDIVAEERNDVLAIPSAALEERRGRMMARTLDENGEPFFKRVELGISDGTLTEVISGLEEGELVAVRAAGSAGQGTDNAGRRDDRMPFIGGGAVLRTR